MTETKRNTVTTTIRFPKEIKAELKKIAKDDGLSENSAMVQGLAWWVKFRKKMEESI